MFSWPEELVVHTQVYVWYLNTMESADVFTRPWSNEKMTC